ncbi:MAG: recombination protein RecR [Acidiferrobacteraceae bacterium]|nr:recombination protein RecR [Acidiferrobacteraceae bacterium]
MKRPESVTKLIGELKRLPGIGQKTAERLSFFIMRGSSDRAEQLARAIISVKDKISLCQICHSITENDVCGICHDSSRDPSIICVVEEPYDVFVIENMGEFNGVYHVLMGTISPLDGIGPDDLTLEGLKERVAKGGVTEVIVATNPNMEGESTAVYISRFLQSFGIKITRIARGLPMGGDIEYADPVTLLKSIEGRKEMSR